jgi:hypothetical protein
VALESVSDKDGSVTFGLVGPGVFFFRVTGSLSPSLGASHLQALQAAVEVSGGLRYFADTTALKRWDVLALSAFVRLVLSRRRKFSDIVILNAIPEHSEARRTLTSALGEPIEMIADRVDFGRRLMRAAPSALKLVQAATSQNRHKTPPPSSRRL